VRYLESSLKSLNRSASLLSDVLIIPGMLTRVDAIVEHLNFAVRHHLVDQAYVHVLPAAVGIAQALIDTLGCYLRLADTASMRTDLVRKRFRAATDQCSKRDNP
jgi:hypothetical protein